MIKNSEMTVATWHNEGSFAAKVITQKQQL